MELEKILSNVNLYLTEKNSQQGMFIPDWDSVPVSGTKFSNIDIINLVTAALGGWVTEGRYSELFANKLKKFTNLNHAVLCNSGSSANLLAMVALKEYYDISGRPLIVTNALAFPTTISAILYAGFIPYFVDSNYHSLNPSIDDLIDLADSRDVAGLILSHTLGFPINLTDVAMEYHRNKKFVIEDCCDALGSKVNGESVGQWGDVATFSFFPAHHISTGEGGAVLCNDGKLMKIIRSYANWGRDCWCKPGQYNSCYKRFEQDFPRLPEHYDHKYITSRVGFNLKMTDLQAALGSSQMDRIDDITKARKDHYNYLLKGLKEIPNFTPYFGFTDNEYDFSPFGFPITCLITNRDHTIQFLESKHIRTRPIFAGNITRQPMMDHINFMQHGSLEGCDFVAENSFWIGCHPELSYAQLDYVIKSFDEYLRKLHGKN